MRVFLLAAALGLLALGSSADAFFSQEKKLQHLLPRVTPKSSGLRNPRARVMAEKERGSESRDRD